MTTCPGCGVQLPLNPGPVHAYIGASAPCWALHGQLLAWVVQAQPGRRSQQLCADAYAAQHPGEDSRRSRQSVCLHLIGLYLTCELKLPTDARPKQYQQLLAEGRDWPWLAPPPDLGPVRGQDVLAAPEAERAAKIEAWAGSVWQAWAPHHARVAELWRERRPQEPA